MKLRAFSGLVAMVAVACVHGGCRAHAEDADTQGEAIGQCAVPGIALQRVFPGVSFRKPTAMAQDPTDPTRFYIAEKEGLIKTVTTKAGDTPTVFADLTDRVAAAGAEPGINGIAFHPNFPSTNEVYITYDGHHPNATPPVVDFEWVLARYKVGGGVIDRASEERLIQIDKYDSEHNGGNLVFKNENGKNLLYVSVGDGSPANEQVQNHPEIKVSQDTRALLGKMLRLDVAARQDGHVYGYPDDNPFAVKGIRPGQGRAEIYAWGLRNPWRFSFDRKNPGDLWLGDVGQDAFEEVDKIVSGKNYGWLPKEATHCSNADAEKRRLAGDPNACPVADEVLPVVEYPHNGGSAAVIGGYVYHGASAPDLEGTYVFGDYVSGNVSGLFSVNGKLTQKTIGQTGKAISSFFEDKSGEVYLLDHSAGQIWKLVAGPCADTGGQSAAPYKWLMREGVGDQNGAVAYYTGFQEPGVAVGTYSLGDFGQDTLGIDPNARDVATLTANGQKVNRGTYRNKLDLGFVREMVCSKPAAFAAAGAAFKTGKADGAPGAGCYVRNWKSLTDYQDFVEGRTDGTLTLGTVAMNVNNGFTHFYVFNAKGLLATQATLDSEGPKFMPQLCTPCHSGQYRGKGAAINLGSIFREFEPDALDPGVRLVLDDPSGVVKTVANDAAGAQADWFALNQSARAANDALLPEGSVPSPKGTQKFDDTNITPGGFDTNHAAIANYVASMYPSGAPPALGVGAPEHLPASWAPQQGESAEFVSAKANVWEKLTAKFCMGCHRTNPKPFDNYQLFAPLAAEQDGVALLDKYTSFDPADPQRKTLVGMPQSELMFNTLNGLDTPSGFPTQGLSLTPDSVAARQAARDAIFDWLIQSSNPFAAQSRVTFEVDGADGTQVGDWVYIVGSIPELGVWNPVQGVRCEGSHFPNWTCTVNLPRGVPFEFKAIKFFRFGQVIWERERGQGNRHYTATTDLTQLDKFTWDDLGP